MITKIAPNYLNTTNSTNITFEAKRVPRKRLSLFDKFIKLGQDMFEVKGGARLPQPSYVKGSKKR